MLFQRRVSVPWGASGDLVLNSICSDRSSKWHQVCMPLGPWASHKLHSNAATCAHPSSAHTLMLVEADDCKVSVLAAPSSADRQMAPPWGTNTWIQGYFTALSWPVLLLNKWQMAAIRRMLSIQSDLALTDCEIPYKSQDAVITRIRQGIWDCSG